MTTNNQFRKIILFYFLLSASFSTYAVDLVLEAGLHFGGDDLVSATFTSGDTETIEAGGLYSISIGAGFDISEKWQSRITYGFKEDSISASNGSVSFTRYPLNALFLYDSGSWLMGGGLTYHSNITLDGSGLVSALNADFDDAMGTLLELNYQLSRGSYVGARYTMIDYDTVPSASVNAVTVDGNSLGIVYGKRF